MLGVPQNEQGEFRGVSCRGNHNVIDYTNFGLGELNPIRYRSYYFDTENCKKCRFDYEHQRRKSLNEKVFVRFNFDICFGFLFMQLCI